MRFPFKNQPPKLSFCMIVKNEEEFIEGCLRSVSDIVHQIIVVDTGSTDSTLEIARKFGAQIYYHRWCDDFSAARNESIKYATGDWILYLDADERLMPESKAELIQILKNDSILCVNVIIESPGTDNKKGHFSRAHRLFRNLPGVQFSGRIHEQISLSLTKYKGDEYFSTIMIHHLGYALSENKMEKKSQRNYVLLKKQLKDDPNNAYYHYCLAQNLILSKKWEEALKILKKALAIGGLPKDILCSIYNNLSEIYLNLSKYEMAIDYAQKALYLSPHQTTSNLLLYQIYHHLNDRPSQIQALEKVVQKHKDSQRLNRVSIESYVDIYKIYSALAHLYIQEKNWVKAKFYFEQIIQKRPNHADSCDLANLEKLAIINIKLKNFVQAAQQYEKLLKYFPKNKAIRRRLAALYHKIGKREKAHHILFFSK